MLLSFTEIYRRNDENKIGGALRCVDSFSISLGDSSSVNLNKSPIYIISSIFFYLYRAENVIGDRSAEEHVKNLKTSRGP